MGGVKTFVDLPAGQPVFLDANPLVDHFSANPVTGAACQQLLQRIASGEFPAFTSAHIVGEAIHRLLSIEACAVFGWPFKGIAHRMASHPAEIQKLSGYRKVIADIDAVGIQVLPVLQHSLMLALDVIQQHGLLFNDSLVVAIMSEQGITQLASNDADFDRIPGITRFAPV